MSLSPQCDMCQYIGGVRCRCHCDAICQYIGVVRCRCHRDVICVNI